MPRGTVREYDPTTGLGVIEEESGKEVRVHRSGLDPNNPNALYPGDIVEFEIGRSRKGGPTAVDVIRVGWEKEGEAMEWTV